MGKSSTPAVDLSNEANLIGVLRMLNANDTAAIGNAEKMLKPFLKHPSSAVPLIHLLRTCQEVPVRHHASLLLKKKLAGYYVKFTAQQQQEIKTQLVSLLLAEPNGAVATGIAGAIAAVASAVFSGHQQWNELFSLLLQLSQDPNERQRVITFKLLTEVRETCST